MLAEPRNLQSTVLYPVPYSCSLQTCQGSSLSKGGKLCLKLREIVLNEGNMLVDSNTELDPTNV